VELRQATLRASVDPTAAIVTDDLLTAGSEFCIDAYLKTYQAFEIKTYLLIHSQWRYCRV